VKASRYAELQTALIWTLAHPGRGTQLGRPSTCVRGCRSVGRRVCQRASDRMEQWLAL